MTLKYSLYLDTNTPGRKVFHAYYYRSSVPHAERTKGAAPTASYRYCQDAVTDQLVKERIRYEDRGVIKREYM
jgi:hypothetical protein